MAVHYYRDVALAPNGSLHKVKAWSDFIQFDQEQPVRLQFPALFVRLFVGDFGPIACWKDHETGDAYVLRAEQFQPRRICETVGNWPCAWGPTGDIYVQRYASGELERFDKNGVLIGSVLTPVASEGIHHIRQSGLPTMGNDPSLHADASVYGAELWQLTKQDGWVVGQGDGGGELGGLTIVLPDGQLLMHEGYTPHSPRIARSGLGEFTWIAKSGDNTPEPDQLLEECKPYVKYVPPVPVIPQPAPIAITFGPAPEGLELWFGCTNENGLAPGNCAWGAAPVPDDRPVTEMSPWANQIDGRRFLHGLWLSDNGAHPDTVLPEIALTKAKGAKAVYLHCDDWNQQADNVLAAADHVRQAGLIPIYGVHAVEKPSDFLKAFDYFKYDVHLRGGLLGVTLNGRTHGKDAEMFAACIANVLVVLEEFSIFYVAGDFAKLEADWPDLGRLLRELAAKVKTPKQFPGVPAPVPVEPPPVVMPTKPPYRPNRGRGGKQEEKPSIFSRRS